MLNRRLSTLILFFFLLGYPLISFSSNLGMYFTYPIMKLDPKNFYGYRAALWYQPPSLVGEHFSIYFDGSYGHWWVTGSIPYNSISIISAAPTVRFYITKNSHFSPFFNASIGLSYLSKTHIANRYLGTHFAFQDELGLGATLGPAERFTVIVSILHYSNGSLAHVNAGITVPLLLTVGYRF